MCLQRSLLLDCEDRINVLLAIVFENYKSLDEHSITGLSELFGPITDCAAPALAPAVQIFSVLHDILSNEAQSILRSYLQVRILNEYFKHFAFVYSLYFAQSNKAHSPIYIGNDRRFIFMIVIDHIFAFFIQL
jgi:hypothetical protein